MKKNLYVFEPHAWKCSRGAMMIVAESFEQAVMFAITNGRDRTPVLYDGLFSRSRAELEKVGDKPDGKWLLTHELRLADDIGPGILVNSR